MKKVLLILLALLVCTCLAACNPSEDPNHVHSFTGEWHSDASGHWLECECGEKGEVLPHNSDGDACTDCGYKKSTPPEHVHSFTGKWHSDASGHWKQCSCGVRGTKSDHTFKDDVCTECGYDKNVPSEGHAHDFDGAWQSDENEHWKECPECGTRGEVDVHDFTGEWHSDEYGHWKECTVCGARGEESGHYFIELNSDASEHWMECECGAQGEKFSHSFGSEYVSDEHEHYKICECGAKTEESPHIFGSDYISDDNEHWQICTVCGGESERTAHNIDSEWHSDDSWHYKECEECGAWFEQGSHNIGDYISDEYEHWHYCDECGQTFDRYSHVAIGDWCSDENGHWFECECGAHVDETGHNYGNYMIEGDKHYRICNDCNYTSEKAEHTYGEYVMTEAEHYKQCVCGVKESETLGDHKFVDGICLTCNYSSDSIENLRFTPINDKDCSVTGVEDKNVTRIVIPDKYQGKRVTSIGDSAFFGCTYLQSVSIPDSITSIGINAFELCPELHFEIENNAKYLGNSDNPYFALIKAQDSNITDCTINSATKIIADQAFSECYEMQSVNIPLGVTRIGNYAFYNCHVTSLELPSSVNSIGSYAFYGCRLGGDIIIPSGVTLIEENTFAHCGNLVGIEIPNSVESIGDNAFAHCSALTSVKIGTGIMSIGEDAFFFCDNISEVRYAGDVSSWIGIDFVNDLSNPLHSGSKLYAQENEVENLTLPDELTEIRYQFVGCMSISSIKIGDKLTTVTEGAFLGCDNISEVRYAGDVSSWCKIEFADSDSNPLHSGAALYLQNETLAEELSIPAEVSEIKPYAFVGCDSIKSLTIADGIGRIGTDAFTGCPIEEATIPGNACEFVENDALRKLTVTSGNIPGGSVSTAVFRNTSYIRSLTIGEGVTGIGQYALSGCNYVEDVTLPAWAIEHMFAVGITSGSPKKVIITSGDEIKENAFANLRILSSIEIPDTIKRIGKSAFVNCVYLTEVKYGGDLASWCSIDFADQYANPISFRAPDNKQYYNGAKLYIQGKLIDNLTVSGVETIKAYAFHDYRGLLSLTVGDGVKSIGADAFSNCDRLESVTIGNSVNSIGISAFYDCSSLLRVTIGSGVKSIGQHAFSGYDYKLVEICNNSTVELKDTGIIRNSVKHIYKSGTSKLKEYKDFTFYADDATNEYYLMSYNGEDGDVTLPDDYNGKEYKIYQYAFLNDYNIYRVTIGAKVTEIGICAFSGCERLIEVCNKSELDIQASEVQDGSLGQYAKNIYKEGEGESNIIKDYKGYTFYVQYGTGDFLLVDYDGTDFELTLPDNYEGRDYGIYKFAFYNHDTLRKITIGKDAIRIYEGAFYNCPIEDITMPALNVEDGGLPNTIGDTIKTVTITEGNISTWFGYCRSLESVTIQSKVTNIRDNAFHNCINLKSVTMEEGVKSIGKEAFEWCISLTTIDIPDSVTTIGEYAFSECSSLESVTLGENVTTIGTRAFCFCDNLESVTMGNKVESIGDRAFYGYKTIYYQGTKDDWERISIGELSAKVIYFSLDDPYENETAEEGESYWHYVEGNRIEVWQKH